MNVKMLERIKEKITKTPTSFHMADWARTVEDFIDSGYVHDPEHFKAPECGTVACIGGWAATLDVMDRFPEGLKDEEGDPIELSLAWSCSAARAPEAVLEIDHIEGQRLFYTDKWPDQFEEDYNVAVRNDNFEEAAGVACARIDHFIATDGRE